MSFLMGKGRNNGRRTRPNPGGSLRQNRVRGGPQAAKSHQNKGGGQVLLQRPSQQTKVQSQKQDIDLRTLGIISMDEVLADLNILQQQQIESDQRLKQARLLKQRRLEQQTNLEKALQHLKIQNGQQRAAVESANETLSGGQRRLINSRARSDGGGNALRNYDRKVKMAISVPPALAFYGRKHDQQLETISSMVQELERIVTSLEDEYERNKHELSRAKQQDEEMRQSLRNQALQQSRMSTQFADSRSATRDEEDRVALCLLQERSFKSQVDGVDVARVAETGRHAKEQTLLSDHQHDLDEEASEAERKKRRLQEELNGATQRFTADWNATISIQKSEAHQLSLQPSETTEPPLLDINLIRLALDQESRAISDEAEAKEELVFSLAALRDSLDGTNRDISTAETSLDQENCVVDELTSQVQEREFQHSKLSDMLETLCRENGGKLDEFEKFKELSVTRLDGVPQQILNANNVMAEKHSERTLTDEEFASRQETVQRMKKTLAESKESNQKSLVELEKQFHGARQHGIELYNKFNNIESAAGGEQPRLDEKTLAKYKQVTKIIKQAYKKYAKLKDAEIEFRPELTHEQQAETDFADLLLSCKARQKSAQQEIDLLHQQKDERLAQEVEKNDDHPPAGEDSAEAKTKTKAQSAAKPRFLLPKFVEASIDPNMASSEEDEGIPFESAPNQPYEPYPDSIAQADKRVHWQDEDADGMVEKQAISTETKQHSAMEFDDEIHMSNLRDRACLKESKTPANTSSEKGRRRTHDYGEDKLALLKKMQSGQGKSENKRRRLAHTKADEVSSKSVSSKTSKKKACKNSEAASSVATSVVSRKSKSKQGSRSSLSSDKTMPHFTSTSEITTTKSRKPGSKQESKARTQSSLRATSSNLSVTETLGSTAAKHKKSSLKKRKPDTSSATAAVNDSKSSEKAKKQASLKQVLVGSSVQSKKRGSSSSKEHTSHSKKKIRVAPKEQPSQKLSSKPKRPPIRRRRVGTTDSAKSSRSLKDVSFTFG